MSELTGLKHSRFQQGITSVIAQNQKLAMKRFMIKYHTGLEVILHLQRPGLQTHLRVIYLRMLCASILRFWLLEHTTATRSA